MRLPALLACALGAALLPAADLLEANRDPAVAPTADFWRHANARWHAAHPLAADRASYYSYDWLDDLVRSDVLALHRELLDPCHHHLGIRALYKRWQLSDSPSTGRAFKVRYGTTPAALRRQLSP